MSGSSTPYDLLLHGGEVIDPEKGPRFRADVAAVQGKIAAVGPDLDPASASRVIDVAGQIVTPGLIDMHAHGYWGVTFDGLRADAVAGRTGVTTWVDPGSAGAQTFPGFRRYVIEQTRTRILPFLNLCAIGVIYRGVPEFNDLRWADVGFAVEMIEEHRDLVVGVKVRVGREIVRDNADHPLWLAREVGDRVRLPIMVHIGQPPPTLRQVLAALRPGDIVTHCYTGNASGTSGIILNGKLRPEAVEARERGVRFDVGHGAGSFSFRSARAALEQGFSPDTISSDLHQQSIRGPAYDLPTVMSKLLALGLGLEDVVRMATLAPAQVLGRTDGIGTLRVGAPADLAVFEVQSGQFTYADVLGETVLGSQRLVNKLTIRAGQEMPRDLDYGELPLFVKPRG